MHRSKWCCLVFIERREEEAIFKDRVSNSKKLFQSTKHCRRTEPWLCFPNEVKSSFESIVSTLKFDSVVTLFSYSRDITACQTVD